MLVNRVSRSTNIFRIWFNQRELLQQFKCCAQTILLSTKEIMLAAALTCRYNLRIPYISVVRMRKSKLGLAILGQSSPWTTANKKWSKHFMHAK